MNIEVLDTADSVAQRAAAIIAEDAKTAIAARGRFLMAVSGGHTVADVARAGNGGGPVVGRPCGAGR
jgi:6-phosphogluconolactonase/glucosamine-6-phosphate isomerase/deaminase